MTTTRAAGRNSRRAAPSRAVTTQSAVAPASSAAGATSEAPCPYASAFTTAHTSAGAAASRRRATLRRRAPRSIVISERYISDRSRERKRKGLDDVAGDEAGDAVALGGEPGRHSPRCRRGGGCEPRFHPLGEEGGNDAREDVAGPGSREPGIAEITHEHAAPRRGDQRVRPLEENGRADVVCPGLSSVEPVCAHPFRLAAEQAR